MVQKTVAESFKGNIHWRLHNYDTNGKTINLTFTGWADDANTWKVEFDGCEDGRVEEINKYLEI